MDRETMIRLFGTDNENEILESKSGRQDKVFSSGVEKSALPSDEIKKLCKKAKIEYLEGYEERVFKYRFTDSTVDWYGDIVDAKGGDLKVFQKQHPVILAFHNYATLPVGACIDVWYDEDAGAIDGYVLFYDDRVDRTGFADTVFRFVSSGGMRACSIGFAPSEDGVYRPTDEERKAWKMGKYGVKFLKWTLLELSVCPVPANPSAGKKSFDTLAQAKAANIIDDMRLEQIAKAIDEMTEDTPEGQPETPEATQEPETQTTDTTAETDVKQFEVKITEMNTELKDLLIESINYVKILTEKVSTLQDTVEKISIKDISDPVLNGEPEDNSDIDIYETVLGASLDLMREIQKIKTGD